MNIWPQREIGLRRILKITLFKVYLGLFVQVKLIKKIYYYLDTAYFKTPKITLNRDLKLIVIL